MSTPSNAPRAIEPFRYAVIDLAIAEPLRSVIPALLPAVAEPLFARTSARKLLEVSPWVVRLSKAPEVSELLDAIGPDAPWGYYVYAQIDIVSLRQTLRRMNLARLPGTDKEVLFRYWDPRVMGTFLNLATPHQRASLFQWIDRIEAVDGAFDRMLNEAPATED